MTVTNMCSNFGGKWDSPSLPAIDISNIKKFSNKTKNLGFSRHAATIFLLPLQAVL